MPWDIKDKNDPGSKLLEVVLTNGWLTNLYRNHLLHYHSTITKPPINISNIADIQGQSDEAKKAQGGQKRIEAPKGPTGHKEHKGYREG